MKFDGLIASARRWVGAVMASMMLVTATMAVATIPARALVEIDITRGNVEPLPIALPNFVPAGPRDQQMSVDLVTVIGSNLERSGLFRPLPQASYIEQISDFGRPPRFGDWRTIKAQALVTGRVTTLANGRVQAEFRLWDVFAQRSLVGLKFVTRANNWRRIGHLISDAIYKAVTGEEGYFDTRIVYIEETGPKDKRVKRLTIMDQDGFNRRYLSDGRALVLTPRFSPTSQEITYMSFRNGRPRVYLYNIDSRQSEIVGDYPNMTFSPRFSPDGQKVIMSLQQGGASNIFELDLRTRATRQLTNTPAIDTAPSFSPDGRQVVFESDRSGEGDQQLYVMNADGTGQHRISFGNGRYSTPVWSPRGDYIAFTKLQPGRWSIGVMKPDGSGERILTEGSHNEGPTWSPNGRVIMFFRNIPGPNGGPKLWSVDLTGYNERIVPTPGFASDPAWSPLLK